MDRKMCYIKEYKVFKSKETQYYLANKIFKKSVETVGAVNQMTARCRSSSIYRLTQAPKWPSRELMKPRFNVEMLKDVKVSNIIKYYFNMCGKLKNKSFDQSVSNSHHSPGIAKSPEQSIHFPRDLFY